MSLTAVEPLTLTDAQLIASNVAETDYSEWSSGTTYALGNRVIRVSQHAIYESLQASNTNHTPESSPTWWVRVGPTNRWRAWDTSSNTQTSNPGTITYHLQPATGASVIAFVNLRAIAVSVRVVSPAGATRFERTVDTVSVLQSSDWHAYFFAPVTYSREVVLDGVVVAAGDDVYLEIANGSDDVAVGAIVLGPATVIGEGVQYGATTGIRDYSVKRVNDYGDTVLVQRAFSKRAEFTMWVAQDVADAIQYKLTDLRSVPALWIGVPDAGYGRTVIFGYYRDFEMRIRYPQYTELAISIEGLT